MSRSFAPLISLLFGCGSWNTTGKGLPSTIDTASADGDPADGTDGGRMGRRMGALTQRMVPMGRMAPMVPMVPMVAVKRARQVPSLPLTRMGMGSTTPPTAMMPTPTYSPAIRRCAMGATRIVMGWPTKTFPTMARDAKIQAVPPGLLWWTPLP